MFPLPTAVECRLALLDERLGRLLVVLGLSGADVMGGLHVEALAELAVHGAVEVLLHVAVGHGRPGGQPTGPLGHLVVECLDREDRVDDAEPFGVLRVSRSEK